MNPLYICLIALAYIIIGLLGLFLIFPISKRLGHTISLQPDEYGDDDWGLIILSSLIWPIGLTILFIFILCFTYSRLVHIIEHYWNSKYGKQENV
jgi:hypothetical protein